MLPQAHEGTTCGDICYVGATGTGATLRRRFAARPNTAGRNQTDLHHLIADLAAQFVAIRPDAIEETMQSGLRQIADGLQLDRATLWRPASIPFFASQLHTGEAAWFTRFDEILDPADRAAVLRLGLRSAAVVPLAMGTGENGALALASTALEYVWTPAIIEQLRLAAGVFGLALARQANHAALQSALDELRQRCERTTEEGALGRPEVGAPRVSHLIVSASQTVRHALSQTEIVARTPATVLLLGETGAGKELFARAIHELSPRCQRQMIRVNCAAIPAALMESELFGRERGAYTGAVTKQVGRFEAANMSTIFLDEIGELPLELQAKLLRVLQERVIERLGSTQAIKVDVRIIAATNRNLEKAVADKLFREDLFYRLNVFPITVPPLRERIEDIPTLVWEFIDEFAKSFGKPIESISRDSMRQLELYSWPGNVRELRNIIERAVILATGPRLTVAMPQPPDPHQPEPAMSLANLELEHIRATLENVKWRIRGAGGAAELLGLKPTTLESRLAKLGLVRPSPAPMSSSSPTV